MGVRCFGRAPLDFRLAHELGRSLAHPVDELGDLGMTLQALPGVEVACELAGLQGLVDLSVADAVDQKLVPSALGAGQQVMLIDRGPGDQGPAAQWAGRWLVAIGQPVVLALLPAQGSFGNHESEVEGGAWGAKRLRSIPALTEFGGRPLGVWGASDRTDHRDGIGTGVGNGIAVVEG